MARRRNRRITYSNDADRSGFSPLPIQSFRRYNESCQGWPKKAVKVVAVPIRGMVIPLQAESGGGFHGIATVEHHHAVPIRVGTAWSGLYQSRTARPRS